MVTISAQAHHPAVPKEDIIWLHDFMNGVGNPVPFERAIHIMKQWLFPWDLKSNYFPVVLRFIRMFAVP